MAKTKPRLVSPAPDARGGNNKTTDQPGYFLSLTIRNVRCFGDVEQTLDLSDGKGRPAPWTILLGDNGTGKTTLLQTIAAVSALGIQWATPLGEIFGHSTSGVLTALDGPVRSLVRRGPGEQAARFRAVLLLGVDIKACRGPRNCLTVRFMQVKRAAKTAFDVLEASPPTTSWPSPRCFGYGAGRRRGGGAITITSDWRTGLAIGLFQDDNRLRNAESWLSGLDWAASQESPVQARQQKRLDEVKELLVKILPDVTRIRRTAPQTETDRPHFEFETPYGWVQLRQLGYGYQTMIAWMVDFASRMVERYPDSADPLAEPAVVLVDEIDLHLHPKWQRELMGYLSERFPNTQFIATAHSPLIVQAAASVNANIAVLRRDGDHVVIDNRTESVRGWRLDQILTSDLYDLPTARAKEFDEAIQRRTQILGKSRVTKRDREELAHLNKKLDQLPAGETASDARTLMELAKDTAELLKKHRG